MILRKYSSSRVDLNCHQIERLEISQNNEYGVLKIATSGLKDSIAGAWKSYMPIGPYLVSALDILCA